MQFLKEKGHTLSLPTCSQHLRWCRSLWMIDSHLRNPNRFFLTNSIKSNFSGQVSHHFAHQSHHFQNWRLTHLQKIYLLLFECLSLQFSLMTFPSRSLTVNHAHDPVVGSENQHIYNNSGIFYMISLLLNKNIVLKVSHAHPVNAGLVISPT